MTSVVRARASSRDFRWANVPVPEPLLAAIGTGLACQVVRAVRIPIPPIAGRVAGTALIAAGGALVAWAVDSAGDTSVDRPARLITTGAYELTRNPMYVGWTAGVAGLALLTRNGWMAVATVVAAGALHREVRVEEARLGRRFGSDFAAYRAGVPRYLPAVRAART